MKVSLAAGILARKLPAMPVLREKQVRRKPRAPRTTDAVNTLSPEEQTNVQKALRVLRIRHGGWASVARQMSLKEDYVKDAASGRHKKPGAGLALRVARLAGVSAEDVLSGAFPEEGCCPMCGGRLP